MTSLTPVRRFGIFICAFFLALSVAAPRDAHALDKRLKLAFKTAGYGAGGGLVIGAATVAMGMGGFRNVLMGASAGMYAGLLFAGYIIATPDERDGDGRGSRNPYAPRKPVGPDDFEEGEEGLENHIDRRRDDDSRNVQPGLLPEDPALALGGGFAPPAEIAVWAPVVSLTF